MVRSGPSKPVGGGEWRGRPANALPATIRAAMGNRADEQQLGRLRRILEEKDAASYGARIGRMDHARELHVQLQRFSSWVEMVLSEG